MPSVFIASDHAGFELKATLIAYLKELGYTVDDVGAHTANPDDDYPDFVIPCAHKVVSITGAFGIIIGGSGEGEAMAANRVLGARAGVWYGGSHELVQLMRTHNNANILSLGARFVNEKEAKDAVKTFLETPFPGDARHVRRLAKF